MEEQKKNKKKEQPLYTIEYESTVEDMTATAKEYPFLKKNYFIAQLIIYTIIFIFLFLVSQLFFKICLWYFICAEIIIVAITLLNNNERYKQAAENALKKRKNKNIITEFYKEYFTREIDNVIYKIYYKDIIDSIETQTHFFIRTGNNPPIYPINKKYCEKELIDFIRSKIEKIDTKLTDEIKFKPKTQAKNPKLLKIIMQTLFILSIMCIPLSIIGIIATTIITGEHCIWIYFCFIPIQLISVITALLIKNKNFDNVKIDYSANIYGGIVMIFIILFFGVNSSIPIKNTELNKEYKEIAQVEFPNKTLHSVEITTSDYDEKYKWKRYQLFKYSFSKKDAEKFEEQIKSSNNWLLNPKLDDEYVYNRPFEIKIDENTYILNYHPATKEYNTFSTTPGDYIIITYNKKTRHMEIHKYRFYYRKGGK